MTVFIGHYSLIAALIITCASGIFGLKPTLPKWTKISIFSTFFFLTLALLTLLFAYSTSDFSVLNVYMNSHTAKPMLYKIAGVWGNHEGSMLLLIWILSLWTMLFMLSHDISYKHISHILTIQSLLSMGLLGYLVITSNPFIQMPVVPENGLGLNPLLQDVGLAIHPPMLYAGYVGFSIPFSAAIVALLYGKCDAHWAPMVQRWSLVSWGFLTLGIGLGSSWAYRELGWGGFWFWDPVENASLIPWLVGTALIHSITVSVKKNGFYAWTVLLALLTFLLCLLGTLIVRSGLITSVHNFAQDPERGLFILGFLSIIASASLLLYGLRAHTISKPIRFQPLSREMMLLVNNMLMMCACATVLIGTLYPLFYEWWIGQKLSVGMPYYVSTFIPIFSPLILLASIGPLIAWGEDNLSRHRNLLLTLLIGIMLTAALSILTETHSARFLFGMFFAFSVMLSMLQSLARKTGFGTSKWHHVTAKARALPLTYRGMILAHIGVGVLTFAVTALDAWTIDMMAQKKVGESFVAGPYKIILNRISMGEGPNYYLKKAQLTVEENGDEKVILYPEIRLYPTERTVTTEAALYITAMQDYYATIGDNPDQETLTIRFYIKPFVLWIWIGGGLMALGGFVSFWGRRNVSAI